MNTAIAEALRQVARAQLRFAEMLASTQGRDAVADLIGAYNALLVALDEEPSVGRLFKAPMKKSKR